MTPDQATLGALEHHARSHNGGLGDPPLIHAARRAMTGDPEALAYCVDQLEMMRLTGATLAPAPPALDLADLLDKERNAHQVTLLELDAARDQVGRDAETILDLQIRAVAAADEIADLKARILGMTAVAADANRDVARHAGTIAELRSEARSMFSVLTATSARLSAYESTEGTERLRVKFRTALMRLGAIAETDLGAGASLVQPTAPTADRVYTPDIEGSCLMCNGAYGEHRISGQRLGCPPPVADLSRQCVADTARIWMPGEDGVCMMCDQIRSEHRSDPGSRRILCPVFRHSPHEVEIADPRGVVGDPDSTGRMDPDEIAALARELTHDRHTEAESRALVALADLVEEWIAATKIVSKLDASGHAISLALERQDKAERALVRAVKR